MHLEESPWCPCSRDNPDAPVLMTCLHILQECARYHEQRHILAEAVLDIMNPTWQPRLLAEPKRSLPALANFLDKSGAFTKLGITFHIHLILPPLRDPRLP